MRKIALVPRIYIRLEAFLGNRKVVLVQSHSKEKIWAKLKHAVAEKYYLKVTYAPSIYNDGYYTNKKALLFPFRCFTNPSEIQFLCDYNSIGIKGEK